MAGLVPIVSFVSAMEVFTGIICACLPRIYILFSGLYQKYRSRAVFEKPFPLYPMADTPPAIHSLHEMAAEGILPSMGVLGRVATCAPKSDLPETDSNEQGEARWCRYSNAASSDTNLGVEVHPWTPKSPRTRPASV